MSVPTPLPVTFLPLGAIIQSFMLGGRNLVLGFPQQWHYHSIKHPYFGETIGRIPNRLSDGKIHNLNGRDYDFAKNEGQTTTLHGGVEGWGKKIWDGPQVRYRNGREVIQFILRSPSGDEGFPGQVDARVWYGIERRLDGAADGRGNEEVILDIEYEVEMTGNESDIIETVCAMTNHSYWNLADAPTVAGTEVTFWTNLHLELDEKFIPTGVTTPLQGVEAGKPILFTETGPAIDQCFVLDTDIGSVPLDTRARPLRKCVSMYHAGTKTHLDVETTEPSFQFYSGDGIDVAEIPGGKGVEGAPEVPRRGPRSGIAVEPNRYVNAVNRPEWRSLVLLKRGQLWGCRNRFTVCRD
jgi:aldose 1-epimerase